jgi:hypothetical protein
MRLYPFDMCAPFLMLFSGNAFRHALIAAEFHEGGHPNDNNDPTEDDPRRL